MNRNPQVNAARNDLITTTKNIKKKQNTKNIQNMSFNLLKKKYQSIPATPLPGQNKNGIENQLKSRQENRQTKLQQYQKKNPRIILNTTGSNNITSDLNISFIGSQNDLKWLKTNNTGINKLHRAMLPEKYVNSKNLSTSDIRRIIRDHYDVSIYYPNFLFTKNHIEALFDTKKYPNEIKMTQNKGSNLYYIDPPVQTVKKTIEQIDNYWNLNKRNKKSPKTFNNDITRILRPLNNQYKNLAIFVCNLQELQQYEEDAYQALSSKNAVLLNFGEEEYNRELISSTNYLVAAYEQISAFKMKYTRNKGKNIKSYIKYFDRFMQCIIASKENNNKKYELIRPNVERLSDEDMKKNIKKATNSIIQNNQSPLWRIINRIISQLKTELTNLKPIKNKSKKKQ